METADTKNCDTCGREWPLDRYRADNPCPDTCFRCRTMGVSLALQGGKSYWHNGTESERARRAIAEAKKAGFDPVPSETRGAWSSASPSVLSKIGDISKKTGAFGGKPTNATGNTSAPAQKVI